MSPAYYNILESYKSTQFNKGNNFTMNNEIRETYMTKEIKRSKKIPASNQYDVKAADKVMTKGLSKGWK